MDLAESGLAIPSETKWISRAKSIEQSEQVLAQCGMSVVRGVASFLLARLEPRRSVGESSPW